MQEPINIKRGSAARFSEDYNIDQHRLFGVY